MDAFGLASTARGEELIAAWEARVAELSGGAPAAPGAIQDLLPVLLKLMPIVTALLTSGLTPAALIGMIVPALAILFPGLDSQLLDILKQILAFIVKV